MDEGVSDCVLEAVLQANKLDDVLSVAVTEDEKDTVGQALGVVEMELEIETVDVLVIAARRVVDVGSPTDADWLVDTVKLTEAVWLGVWLVDTEKLTESVWLGVDVSHMVTDTEKE